MLKIESMNGAPPPSMNPPMVILLVFSLSECVVVVVYNWIYHIGNIPTFAIYCHFMCVAN